MNLKTWAAVGIAAGFAASGIAACSSKSGSGNAPGGSLADASTSTLGDDASATDDGGGTLPVNADAGASCSTANGSAACDDVSVCTANHCVSVAGNLSGLRWALPCGTTTGTTCQTGVDGGAEAVLTTTSGGMGGQVYDVTLHFRGVVEQKHYSGSDGGVVTASDDGDGGGVDGGVGNAAFFVAGGIPDKDTSSIFELDVSDPPQTYYLNSGTSGLASVWPIDYVATIPMGAGAVLNLTADSVDSIENANQTPDAGPVLLPGVPPYPLPYSGQFVQVDVVGVAVAP